MPDSSPTALDRLGIVVIGRNEGERFCACLASLPPAIPVVYVDSGSTDSSVENAQRAGVHVVHLSAESGFTAARARNMGWRALLAKFPDLEFIQFIDGDCSLDPNWLGHAMAEITHDDGLAIVFGRCRERYPEKSIYNAQCDREWDVPLGDVRSCGGNAFIRVAALVQVDGYTDLLIAGEEPDMCLRMRKHGWVIRRILPEMTLHDAAIHSFGAWWKRAKRAGHAYAEHVYIHKGNADPDWVRALASMVVWGVLLPGLFVLGLGLGLLLHPYWAFLTLAVGSVFTLQFFRLTRQGKAKGLTPQTARLEATLLLVGKLAQSTGTHLFLLKNLTKSRTAIMEYK